MKRRFGYPAAIASNVTVRSNPAGRNWRREQTAAVEARASDTRYIGDNRPGLVCQSAPQGSDECLRRFRLHFGFGRAKVIRRIYPDNVSPLNFAMRPQVRAFQTGAFGIVNSAVKRFGGNLGPSNFV